MPRKKFIEPDDEVNPLESVIDAIAPEKKRHPRSGTTRRTYRLNKDVAQGLDRLHSKLQDQIFDQDPSIKITKEIIVQVLIENAVAQAEALPLELIDQLITSQQLRNRQ